MFADPTQEEEDVVQGAVTVVVVDKMQTCIVHKPSRLLALDYSLLVKL